MVTWKHGPASVCIALVIAAIALATVGCTQPTYRRPEVERDSSAPSVPSTEPAQHAGPARDASAADALVGASEPRADLDAAPFDAAPTHAVPTDASPVDAAAIDAARSDAASVTSATADSTPDAATAPPTLAPTAACAPGYARVGDQCVNVNECLAPGTCSADHQACEDLPGSFRCVCRTPPNLLADPSFEQQAFAAPVAPWIKGPPWETDPENHWLVTPARTGAKSVRLTSKGDWCELSQRVAVKPNSKYKLTAFFRSETPVIEAWIGARKPNVEGSEIGVAKLTMGSSTSYLEVSSTFESGTWLEVELYFGVMPGMSPPVSVELDDVRLERVSTDGTCP